MLLGFPVVLIKFCVDLSRSCVYFIAIFIYRPSRYPWGNYKDTASHCLKTKKRPHALSHLRPGSQMTLQSWEKALSTSSTDFEKLLTKEENDHSQISDCKSITF